MAEAALHSVTKRFGDKVAISGIDLRVADGEFIVLLGPTGAGKTTTLRLFAGLETPEEGRIEIGGEDVTALDPARRDVAFVFQQYSLYPHYTVFDNLAFPLRAPGRRTSAQAIERRVREIAAMLRIESKLANRATTLSGGEMQRVSIGRALVRSPNLFLMDEPLSSLDAKLREDLRVELKRIQRELGATIVYVTHDQLEAMTLADRIGVLSEGALVQIASPRDVYERPANIHAAQRLGSPQINLLPMGALGVADAPAASETIGVRPEDVVLNGNGAVAKVLTIEHLGVESIALLDCEGRHLHALLGARTALRQGDVVKASVRPGAALFFDTRGDRIGSPAPTPITVKTAAPSETALLLACLDAAAAAVRDHEAEIEGLDRAIGDGDHFINLTRGFAKLTSIKPDLAPLAPDAALKAVAKSILMTVGGASGPLIASFFLDMSKAEGADGRWDAKTVARMVAAGVAAIKKRGKAELGDKTMLDVLIPVSQVLSEMADMGRPGRDIARELPWIAETGMLSTKDRLATKGRAAFLGERALGHIDPGSKSSAVIIAAICETVQERLG